MVPLAGQVEELQGQKAGLEAEMQDRSQWLQQLKDKLNKADDVTGSDEDLLVRLNTVKVVSLLSCSS